MNISPILCNMENEQMGKTMKESCSGDSYVDKLLSYIYEHEHDPYRIKDTVIEFTQYLFLMSLKVSMKLYDCYVVGLKSLHRADHCTLWEVDGRIHVKASLGAGTLHYSGYLQIMTFCPLISLEVDVSYIELKVEFSFEVESGRKFTLHDLIVEDMRGVKVGIAGLGPLNWIINPVINKVMSVFATHVKFFLEDKLRIYLMEFLSELKITC